MILNKLFIAILSIGIFFSISVTAFASEKEDTIYKKRMDLYQKMQAVTQIPWYFLAAIDQYERNVRNARKDIPNSDGLMGIYFSKREWVGPLNPNLNDNNTISIQLFGGIGADGNGDGLADIEDDEDKLYALTRYLSKFGTDKDNIKIALWKHYQRDKAVSLIMGFAKMYKTFNTLDLNNHAFPVPLRYNYSYKNTWGDKRGWGGRRIHEGTDIFANYGTPVRATCYGIVEIQGWNKFGGWRIGIRDIHNNYHYYAHLNGFEKGIKVGKIVEPGTVIGYVGSTGYGPPGTQGKFPPHLHYGIYKDNGISEWSFDPYPRLKAWERQERRRH